MLKWIKRRIKEKKRRRDKERSLLYEKAVNDWLKMYQENLSKPPRERRDNSAE